jgi:hypothetical protein
MQTTVKTRDGVETVDSSHTVERSESKSEEAAGGGPAAKWCSLRTLLALLLLAALAVGVYFILTSQRGFSTEKVEGKASAMIRIRIKIYKLDSDPHLFADV